MNKWAVFFLLLGCLAFCSCSDDVSSLSSEGWKVSLAGDEQQAMLPRLASYESLKVVVEGKDAHEFVLVSSSEPWLKLKRDTLPEDGIVAVETETNEESTRREATVTFISTDNPQHVATLTVTQLSRADNDNNSDASAQLFIGYGYDIYKSADNPMSVRTKEPILNLSKLLYYSTPDTYEVIHDSKNARMDMKYYTSYTLSQFSVDLTESGSETNRSITGSLEDCKDALSNCTKTEINEQNFGRGTIIKTVASRVMDRGALDDLQRKGRMEYSFSEGFKKRYEALKIKSGTARMEAIKDLLAAYGTHVVIQADLGGRIDYTFTMEKSATVDNESEMKEEIDFTLGSLPASDRNVNYQKSVSSHKNGNGAIKVTGGSKVMRNQLQLEIAGLTPTGCLSAESITSWLASISYDDNAATHPNLDVVHFGLMPVWDLVDSNLRDDFLNATLDMLSRSDYKLPDAMLSTLLYKLDLTHSDVKDFSSASNASLCKTLYLNDGTEMTPVMEVCQEYVPAIRTDKRVNIVYPIYKNRIRLTQGIFLGDDIYPASRVAFGGSKAYVVPLKLRNNQRTIETLYYVNGNFSTESSGLRFFTDEERNRQVRDDVLMLKTTGSGAKVYKHPIVKIGSEFWTRENIDHNMYFTYKPNQVLNPPNSDYLSAQMLYTRFQYDVNYWFNYWNKWTYGYSPLSNLEGKPNTKWYLPTSRMLADLYAFLGFNPKALFKGQCSGFDAQFCGYVGMVDVLHPGQKFTGGNLLRYDNQLCVVASKDTENKLVPSLLLLFPDYRWQQVYDTVEKEDEKWHNNYYPVRLCRGAYYNFHSLDVIDKKEK